MVNRRIFLSGGAALLVGGAGLAVRLRHPRNLDPLVIRQRAELIGATYGIRIGYGAPDQFYTPPFSVKDARIVGGVATPVDINALPPALDGIERSLRVYPPGFFQRFCKAIFLSGSLILDGGEAGGTYGRAWIILVATKKVGDGGIFETALLGVHHEFSSLIWNHVPMLPARWAALLPAGWTATQSNAQALKASDEGLTNPVDGFLSSYGATTTENDFNVYAETVFTNSKRVATLAHDYPIVARKTALLMSAYTQLDDRMFGVFQRLGLDQYRSFLSAPLEEGVSISPNVIPSGEIAKPGKIKTDGRGGLPSKQ